MIGRVMVIECERVIGRVRESGSDRESDGYRE